MTAPPPPVQGQRRSRPGQRVTHRLRPPRARALGAVLGALLMTAAGTGCQAAGGQDDAVHLQFTWWGSADRAERTEKVIDLFEKEHPGVEVGTSFSEYGPYVQKLATQAAGDSLPDIMQLDYRQISQYAGSGKLADLGGGPAEVPMDDMSANMIKAGSVEGTVYALPLGITNQMVAYDPKLWAAAGAQTPKAGWTWEDYAASGKLVSESTGGKVKGVTDPGWDPVVFETWLKADGKVMYTDDGGLGFTAADLAGFWTFCDGMRRSGAATTASQTTNAGTAPEDNPLGRGLAAAAQNYDATFGATSAVVGDHLRMVPLPTRDGKVGQYVKPSMMISVSKDTPHPEESAELVDFVLNDPEAGKLLGTARGMPDNKEIQRVIGPSLEGVDKAVFDYSKRLGDGLADTPPAPPPADTGLLSSFYSFYESVIFEKATPEEAAENYVSQARIELAQ